MAFVTAVGQVAEVVLKGTLAAGGSNAVPTATILHYRLATLTATPTKTALETIVNTNISAAHLAAANSRYSQANTMVRGLNDALDAYQTFTRAGAGAIATDGLPSVDAVYMLLRTASRGRSYRGSKHWPGVNESDTTDDILVGAGLALWQALQTALSAPLTDALGNIWNLCVFSPTLSQIVTNPTTVISTDVTDVLLNLNVGTMRRRRSATVR